MGDTARAYLAFGVPIDESQVKRLPWAPFEGKKHKLGLEDWIAKINGLVDPYDSRTEGVTFREWHDDPANETAHSEYGKRKQELVAACPIDELILDWDNRTLYVAVRTSITRGDWDAPTDPVLVISDAEINAATSFCEAHGIAFESPRWMLLASYD